jgi:hypothetical protein
MLTLDACRTPSMLGSRQATNPSCLPRGSGGRRVDRGYTFAGGSVVELRPPGFAFATSISFSNLRLPLRQNA